LYRNFLSKLKSISDRVKANRSLADRIRRKYTLKNTIGYSLNALVDFEDPFDIMKHLVVGSEGTLAFIGMLRRFVSHGR
jgi:D-lactate dehydrogenase